MEGLVADSIPLSASAFIDLLGVGMARKSLSSTIIASTCRVEVSRGGKVGWR